MASLQLIFPLLFWAIWRGMDAADAWQPVGVVAGPVIYLGSLVGLIAVVFLAARRAMRKTTYDQPAAVPRFHRSLFFARWMILLLHAFALWGLSYGDAVLRVVPDFDGQFESLPAIASIIPVLVAWVALIWVQYPLDRAVREQNALWAVELGEPVRMPPSLAGYMGHALRSQVLFTLSPILAIALVKDALTCAVRYTGVLSVSTAEWLVTVVSVAVVFTLAPELLRRILPTEPLRPSAVRDRLEMLSKDLRLGVREILLWHTHHAMGNAAVMGVLPGVRYVLITDLLLETMTPDQLEAVFAHEAGHVVHRHIAWYVLFWMTIAMLIYLASSVAMQWPAGLEYVDAQTADLMVNVGGIVAGFVLFGLLSRRFERQADLFAARRLDRPAVEGAGARDGTQIFNSALGHVARLNNLPLDHRSLTAGRPLMARVIGRVMHHTATWLHGSIRSRMNHLAQLTSNTAAARRFDRTMVSVRWAMVVVLAVAAGGIAFDALHRKNELDLDRGVQRQGVHTDGRPGVPAGFAKDLGQ